MILHSQEAITGYTEAGYWSASWTLLDDLDVAASEHPLRIAYKDPPDRRQLVGTDPRAVTWLEFRDSARAVASALIDRGLQKDDVVVVQCPNIWELPLLYLAIATAGGVICPVPMQWRAKDISYVSELADARFFIGPQEFRGHRSTEMAAALTESAGFEHVIDVADIANLCTTRVDDDALERNRPGPNDVFTLCWTSGTESQPKGCPLTHNCWNFVADQLLRVFGLEPTSHRQVAAAPVTNMLGVCLSIVGNLRRRGTVVLHHPLTMDILRRQLVEEDIHFVILPPAILGQLLDIEDGEFDLSGIDAIMTGGSPPAASLIEGFKARWGIEIVNGWGMNEGAGVWAGPDDVPDASMRSDHLPWYGLDGVDWPSGVTGLELRVVDDDEKVVTEVGGTGELRVRGPSVFPGYFGRRDLDATTFDSEGFLRTGDIFQIKDTTFLGYFDRKKDIVIRGGFNVSAAEVENLALSAPGVADCAAVGVPDEVLGERVCLVVVARDHENPPTLDDVLTHLKNAGLAVYKLPERIAYMDELPRNPVGKLLKRNIRRALGP